MNVTVTDVLSSLFNPTDTVCFRVFDDKRAVCSRVQSCPASAENI